MSKSAHGGLRGVSAGQTAICSVGKGSGLNYRGYDIKDLAEHACFEEVAYLLLRGELPSAGQLEDYQRRLQSLRQIPPVLRTVLESLPKDTHPMDVMRTGCSILGNIEPEKDFSEQLDVTDRLLAILPAIITCWYRYSHDGVHVETETDDQSLASYFLHLLHGKRPDEKESRAIDVSLILYAEHEFNASTFTARVCASTLSDMHSAITAAIGCLRGPLHGGANEAAMAMLEKFESVEDASKQILSKLANKEKIMGFGHAVYKTSDPRSPIIQKWAAQLSKMTGDSKQLYNISVECEKTMREQKGLFPNADFYHASTYHFLRIPTKLFTPIFVIGRTSGWAAHVIEQRADNRLIRPTADYIGPKKKSWKPIEER